jgi:hypothetical protein
MRAALPKYFTRRLRGTRAARVVSALRSFTARLGPPTYPTVDLRATVTSPVGAYYAAGGRPALIDVALDHCRWIGGPGLPYSRAAGHPYIRTLLDYETGVTAYARSYLKKYWAIWQPTSLAETYGLLPAACHPLLVTTPPIHDVLPWAGQSKIAYMENREWLNDPGYRALDAAGCPPASSCGPKPDWYGTARFAYLIRLYERIKTDGYRDHAPQTLPYFQQHPVGQVLLKGDQHRIVLVNGQHRAAILCALGQRTLPVVVHVQNHRGLTVVRREDAHLWPLVRSHVFSLEQALTIFDAMFNGTTPAALATLHGERAESRRSEAEMRPS